MYYRQSVRVGEWDIFKGLDWSPLSTESDEIDGEFQNLFCKIEKKSHNRIILEGIPILRVVTREEPPYVMKCLNCSSLSGNQSVAYQGFAIDLLDAISKVCEEPRSMTFSSFYVMT